MTEYLATFDWKDVLGIIGSFIIAGAYYGVSSGRLNAETPPFHLYNLLGACLILFSLYFRPNPGAIMIEILWVTIALVSLTQWARRR